MARGVRKGTAFHKSDETYLEATAKLVDKSAAKAKITDEDARLIKAYLAEVSAESGISPIRKYKIAIQLVGLRRFIPPFREAVAPDLFAAIEEIKIATKDDGAPQFKPNTQADMIRFMKRFFLWLIENDYSRIPVDKVKKKIKSPAYERMTKTAEQLLEEEEVLAMIAAARNTRDRALIALLYESGCRIGEIAALKWSDVRFTENQTAAINTSGKTGKPRYIPIVMARSYLATWKADYPGTPTGDALVFVTAQTHGSLQYAGVVKQLRVIAERAGVKKHVTPHLFRHSRITHLLRKGVPEPVIKRMMWGHLNTNMLQTYGHLVDRDIDDAIAKLYGVVTPEAETDGALEPRQCPRCYSVWGPTMQRCGTCGTPLTPQAAAEEDVIAGDLQRILSKDPGLVLQTLERMQREIGEQKGSL